LGALLQATASGMLTAGMFYFISSAAPLQELSDVRPHSTIFNLYFFGSLLGQFVVQLTFLIYMYK
jgi:cation-transporting ATPase 13A1